MTKITNRSKALQGIRTKGGVVYLDVGETRDLDLEDAELARAQELPFLTVGDEPAKDKDTGDRDALKKQADDLGLEYAKNIPTDKLREQVTAKQADVDAAKTKA